MLRVRSNISKKDWAALYQQDPVAASSNIFSLSDLRYFNMGEFERADGILKKEDLKCIISVDPAFSTSNTSDDAVVLAVGKHKISGNYYLLDGYAETSAPSKTFQAILSMYDRMTQDGFRIEYIAVESVELSPDQQQFIVGFKKYLREHDRYIIVNPFSPRNLGKKEERIKFILEPKISINAVYLRKDMADKVFTRKTEEQIYEFPHSKHDDIIDCLTQGVYILDNRLITTQDYTKKTFFNPLTGKEQTALGTQDTNARAREVRERMINDRQTRGAGFGL